MQRFLKIFSLVTAMTLCSFVKSTEALEHFHVSSNDRALVFSDSLDFNDGLVQECFSNEDGSQLIYLGKWKRDLPTGAININYDRLIKQKANGKIAEQSSVQLVKKATKQGNSIFIVGQDTSSTSESTTLFRHEYVWGNDKIMAQYMLEQYMKYMGKNNVTIMPSYDHTKNLDKEMQAMVKNSEQSAAGKGIWLQTEENDFITGVYYVESDPKAIYRLNGKSLEQLDTGESLVWLGNGTAALALGSNRAIVVMYKERCTEYYDIFFSPVYFIVEKASADDPSVAAELQKEVGIRQQYGPNPRVNLVRERFNCDI